MILSQEKYDFFKKMVSQFNIIDISEKININIKFRFLEIKENKELKIFLLSEMKNLKNGEKRKYITYSETMTPMFFFLSEKYITYVNTEHSIFVYDNKFNENFLFSSHNDEVEKAFRSYFMVFDNKLSLSVSNTDLNNLNDSLTFNLTNKASVIINRADKNKNKFNIDMKTSSKLVSIEFKKDTIIAKFKKSLYKSIILDKECNILEIEFHGITKERLSLHSKLYHITDYSHLISSLSENIELYTLINDSKFHSKTTEQHFNTHIDFIKKLNINKELIINNSQKILNLMNDFPSYKETMLFQNIDNLELLNLNFYNYFSKKLTDKYLENPLQILFLDRTHGLERFIFFKSFFLLLLIEDKEINNDIDNFEIIDSNTMKKLSQLQTIFKNTYNAFNN